MPDSWSIAELSERVQKWCAERRVVPANGQVSEQISERNIRYYRTIGVLDAPLEGGGFGEKHRLQLIAIRLLQAEGLPLRRVRELLYGRSIDDLREIERRGSGARESFGPSATADGSRAMATGQWFVTELGSDLMLVSRSGKPIPAELAERLTETIRTYNDHNTSAAWPPRNK